eukprot:6105522-Lingulodinium_polyedra.AAC.1
MGSRLWRRAPEQLRAASSREAQRFTEDHPAPWAFHDGLRDVPTGEYVPADADYEPGDVDDDGG